MSKKVSSLVIVAPHSKEDVTKLITKLNENGYKLHAGCPKEALYKGKDKDEYPIFLKISTKSKTYDSTNQIIFTGFICCSENIHPLVFEDAWTNFNKLFIKKDKSFYSKLLEITKKDPKYPKIELECEKRKMKI